LGGPGGGKLRKKRGKRGCAGASLIPRKDVGRCTGDRGIVPGRNNGGTCSKRKTQNPEVNGYNEMRKEEETAWDA